MARQVPLRTKPWWERIPGRLEYELERLAEGGFRYSIDENLKASGVLQLTVEYPDNAQLIPLKVTFPDLYPYFRFIVTAPTDLGLLHHQVPFTGDLCILGRATRLWSTEDTLAEILREQVPKVFAAGRAPSLEQLHVDEERQAEPYTDYYPYAPNAMFVIDGAWSVAARNMGEMSGALLGVQDINGIPTLRGVVLKLVTRKGKEFATANSAVRDLSWQQRFRGRWVRLTSPPSSNDPRAVWDLLQKSDAKTSEPDLVVLNESVGFRVRAAVFPEENAHRSEGGEGWLFVVKWDREAKTRANTGVASFRDILGKLGPRASRSEGYYFARGGRMGERDLADRTPELRPLRKAKIVVIGTGCIGAPSVLEFARAQVGRLEILDGDHLDPATVSRWPFGLPESGRPKVFSLADFVRNNYPFTHVVPHARRLGGTSPVTESNEDEVLRELLTGASLLYDATAEVGLQHVLSDYARAAKVPYVGVSGTHGGWGGRIVRIRPGKTQGCWICLQIALQNRDIAPPPGIPESDVAHTVQPGGCADPTFTGAGFDMGAVALVGVRLAVQTLTGGQAGAYPDVDWDIATVSFRDSSGLAIAPSVETARLPRNAECENCAPT